MGVTIAAVLRLVLPKGSLEKATLELFAEADLAVRRDSAVQYKATIADPRVESVRILRPQEIASYVADGLFDLGITGRDWVEETSSEVVSLGELQYSKATSNPPTRPKTRSTFLLNKLSLPSRWKIGTSTACINSPAARTRITN